MADLLRTRQDTPFAPLTSRRSPTNTDRTAETFGQLAKLGAAGIQVYQGEHEKTVIRQAKNDLVNDTINPDLQFHEGAYAQTIAKGNALKGYKKLTQDIANGEYNDTSPEDFQKSLIGIHNEYKQGISKSKHSTLESEAYDNFWLENEATLTAGHAGMYRKQVQQNQNTALLEHMQNLVSVPGVTADNIIESVAQENYTMLDSDDLIKAALTAGIQTGSKSLLEDLNSEFKYDVNPQYSKAYHAAIANIERQDRASNKAQRLEVLNSLKEMQKRGVPLTDEFYTKNIANNPELQDENGNDLLTEKQYSAMQWEGNKNYDKVKAQADLDTAVKNGVSNNGTTAQVQTSYDNISKEMDNANLTANQKAEEFGRIAIASPVKVPLYIKMAKMWGQSDPFNKDGSLNNTWVKDYEVLSAFKSTAGNKTFYNHMDDITAAKFRIAENAIAFGDPTESIQERQEQAAAHIAKMQKRIDSGTRRNVQASSPDIIKITKDSLNKLYPFFGDRGDEFIDKGIESYVAQNAADLLNAGIVTEETLPDALETLIERRYEVVHGSIQDTKGTDLRIPLGGDPNDTIDKRLDTLGIDFDPDSERMTLDVDNGMIIISDLGGIKDDIKIPMGTVKRQAQAETLNSRYKGEILDASQAAMNYRRFEELADMDLTQSDPGVVMNAEEIQAGLDRRQIRGETGEQISGPELNSLYEERKDLRTYINQQEELNQRYFSTYIQGNVNDFDYDADKVSVHEWSKMTGVQKTRTRLESLEEWKRGNETVQKTMDLINKKNSFSITPKVLLEEFGALFGPSAAEASEFQAPVVDAVFNELPANEGESGDTAGAADTGKLGLTTKLYRDIKKRVGYPVTEAEASQIYLSELNADWEKKPGWGSASPALQQALLDTSYNIGPSVQSYGDLNTALKKLTDGGSETDVVKELLDSANLDGKSMKGLAARRAKAYNKVDNKIRKVTQMGNGTIKYLDKSGEVIFKYKPAGGRHPKSKAGSIKI